MTSPWYRRKSFRITVIVVALLVAVLLVAPYFLNIDRYRPAIADLLQRQLGREVGIEKIRLHLLPRLEVEVVNFRLGNPPRFPAGDTLAIGRIGVGLALRPLLRRRVELAWVACTDVELHLLENELGQTNYEFGEAPPATQARKEARPLVSLAQISRVALNNVSVSSSKFRRASGKLHPAWKVSGLTAEARQFDFTRADWQKQVEVEVNLSQAEVTTPTLKQPGRFRDGRLVVKNNASEAKFTLALGKLRVAGQVRVANLAQPVADFHLAADEVNLAELVSLLAASESREENPGSEASAEPQRLLAKGTVQAEKVTFPPLVAEEVRATLRLYNTRLEIDPLTFSLYRGTYKGTADIDLSKESTPMRANFALAGIDVAALTAAAQPAAKSRLTGTLESKMDLQLQLGAARPIATLTGQGEFAIRDGTFPGLNIGRTLATLAKFLQVDMPAGDTRFSYLGGDLRLADERVHSRTLKLDAESLEVAVQGSIGFDKTLDYTGWGVLHGLAQRGRSPLGTLLQRMEPTVGTMVQQTMDRLARMRIPFTVRGTVAEPEFLLAGVPQPIPSSSQEQAAESVEKKKPFRIF